ncbi:unnamed protein product [Cuscuta campestris]|uniref:Uncharacterized protein n=1 Tax=Cuscuta campestris TaxID=132261 RepID=A0A484KP51_9ASTE|nr:unnamed protein product [Cuscuta campestris]
MQLGANFLTRFSWVEVENFSKSRISAVERWPWEAFCIKPCEKISEGLRTKDSVNARKTQFYFLLAFFPKQAQCLDYSRTALTA